MIKSMTGYGRSEVLTADGKKITVEIKSVNHRYSDYTIKISRSYGFLEDPLRKRAAECITRGKVDIYVSIEYMSGSDVNIMLDKEFAADYIAALRELRDEFGLKDDISVMTAAANPDIFKRYKKEEDEQELLAEVMGAFDAALSDFTAMRAREGARICKDLSDRVNTMRALAAEIDARSPETVTEYRDKLYKKLQEILEDKTIDEARILTEAAIFADKVAVNEETVRLASHFDEFDEILASDAPAGRRLDFLVQEINRETNTIGSKASDVYIARRVVELKAELEKMREQIQNIE